MRRSVLAEFPMWILRRLAPRNETVAGDLFEQFAAGRSVFWLWSQLLLGIMIGTFHQPNTPVALNLTPIDPIVAEWQMWRRLHPRAVTLSSPVEGVGGLALMILGWFLTFEVPSIWLLVLAGIVCGVVMGIALAFRRRHHPMSRDGQIHNGELRELFV